MYMYVQIFVVESNTPTRNAGIVPSFLDLFKVYIKGAIKYLFCQLKSLITAISGSNSYITVTAPWYITNKQLSVHELFSILRLGVHCIAQHQ